MICRTVAHGRVILAERHARFGLILPKRICRKWGSVKVGGGSCLNMWVKGKTSIPSGWILHCGKKKKEKKEAMLNTSQHQIPKRLLIAFTEKATEFVCAGARAKNGWLHGHFVLSLLHSAIISSPLLTFVI